MYIYDFEQCMNTLITFIHHCFDNCSLRYGPQFPCMVCHGVCFLSNVVEARGVRGLQTEEGQERFLEKSFILKNIEMFTALDSEWICVTCRKGVDNGSLPQMAAKNGLSNTWAVLPSSLLDLKGVEHEMFSLNQIFQQVDGLELGLVGRKSRQKLIFLPLEAIDHLMQSGPGYPKNDGVQRVYEGHHPKP